MTMLEKTINLLKGLPESTVENVYHYALYLKSDQDSDIEPAHQENCNCPLCRIFRYPTKETLDALEETDNMIHSGSGQHFNSLSDLFTDLEGN